MKSHVNVDYNCVNVFAITNGHYTGVLVTSTLNFVLFFKETLILSYPCGRALSCRCIVIVLYTVTLRE